MRLKAEISGGAALSKALQALDPAAKKLMVDGLKHGVIRVHSEAVRSIAEHRSQGITYTRGNVSHTASAPGNPPNTDRGKLVNSIHWEIDEQALESRVGTNLDYGQHLETGTQAIKPRPWLAPALKKVLPEIKRFFQLKGLGGK